MSDFLLNPFIHGAGNVSGLILRLAARLESFANNDPIGTWTDQSGNGNHFTQSTSGNKPLFKTNIINSLPAIKFDGTDDYLSGPNFVSGLSEGEVFIVLKVDNDPAAASSSSGLWEFGNVGQDAHYPFTDGNIYESWGRTARPSLGNPTPALTSFRLYNVGSKTNDWKVRLDGTQIYTDGASTVGFPTGPLLGASRSLTRFTTAHIAEVLIYDHVLNSTDRDAVEAEIATLYGLTIA